MRQLRPRCGIGCFFSLPVVRGDADPLRRLPRAQQQVQVPELRFQRAMIAQKLAIRRGSATASRLSARSKRVVVFGSFDVLHLGHLDFFRQAKRHGRRLVVVVSSDAGFRKAKRSSPWFSAGQRLKMVRALRAVDEAFIGTRPGRMFESVVKARPDVIVLGSDQKVDVAALKVFLLKNGLRARILRAKPFLKEKFKSSVVKKHLSSF